MYIYIYIYIKRSVLQYIHFLTAVKSIIRYHSQHCITHYILHTLCSAHQLISDTRERAIPYLPEYLVQSNSPDAMWSDVTISIQASNGS
jgi:hypothetical protein